MIPDLSQHPLRLGRGGFNSGSVQDERHRGGLLWLSPPRGAALVLATTLLLVPAAVLSAEPAKAPSPEQGLAAWDLSCGAPISITVVDFAYRSLMVALVVHGESARVLVRDLVKDRDVISQKITVKGKGDSLPKSAKDAAYHYFKKRNEEDGDVEEPDFYDLQSPITAPLKGPWVRNRATLTIELRTNPATTSDVPKHYAHVVAVCSSFVGCKDVGKIESYGAPARIIGHIASPLEPRIAIFAGHRPDKNQTDCEKPVIFGASLSLGWPREAVAQQRGREIAQSATLAGAVKLGFQNDICNDKKWKHSGDKHPHDHPFRIALTANGQAKIEHNDFESMQWSKALSNGQWELESIDGPWVTLAITARTKGETATDGGSDEYTMDTFGRVRLCRLADLSEPEARSYDTNSTCVADDYKALVAKGAYVVDSDFAPPQIVLPRGP